MAWTFKYWRTVGAIAMLSACGGEGGEQAADAGGEAGEAGASAPALDMSIAPAGGEQGEMGAVAAYAGVSGEPLIALRLQHLKGFVLVAETIAAAGQPADAGIVLQQGLLEVLDPAPDQFGDLDLASVRAASQAASTQSLAAAGAAIDAALRRLDIDHAVLAARMVDIATGLYQHVPQSDFVDPIEYQHSRGAALAARDALAHGESALRRANAHAFSEARAELDRFVALWPSVDAPAAPATYAQVLAQGSRVRLALSPYL